MKETSIPICYKRSFALLILAGFVAAATNAQSQSPKSKGVELTITTDELRSATVIGDLGVPIGTLITIEGAYKDMTFTGTKQDEGRIALVISNVNGRKLAKPVEFDADYYLRKLVKPKDKEQFKLLGYEVGEFNGDVEGAGRYDFDIAKASEPFGYHSDFVWLSDITRNIAKNRYQAQ